MDAAGEEDEQLASVDPKPRLRHRHGKAKLKANKRNRWKKVDLRKSKNYDMPLHVVKQERFKRRQALELSRNEAAVSEQLQNTHLNSNYSKSPFNSTHSVQPPNAPFQPVAIQQQIYCPSPPVQIYSAAGGNPWSMYSQSMGMVGQASLAGQFPQQHVVYCPHPLSPWPTQIAQVTMQMGHMGISPLQQGFSAPTFRHF